MFKIRELHPDGGRFDYDDIFRTREEAEAVVSEYENDDGDERSVIYEIYDLKKCPRCGKMTLDEDEAMNALSRHADAYICSECETQEALFDYEAFHFLSKILDLTVIDKKSIDKAFTAKWNDKNF